MSDRESRLIDLAAACSDGSAIDWDAAESSAATDSERLQVRNLRLVRALADEPAAESWPAAASRDANESLLSLSTSSEPGSDATPLTWGPLRVIQRIGRGRFGDVYRARDPRLDRDVALKLLRGREAGAGDLDGVVHEGRLLARIHHPNVVAVFGAERVDGRAGVWMELIRGRTLADELFERGPLPADEVIAVGADVCRALDAVHRAGLVHRDVKAQNVMRDHDGRIVLMDFGTGRDLETSHTDDLAGTPLYLAPEVIRGDPATPQSDIYSAGVLLFHLATGTFPVAGRTLRDIRAAHATGAHGDLSALTGVPAPLAAAITAAIAPAPHDRTASAESLLTALMDARSAAETGPLPRRRRLAVVLAAGAVLTVGVALVASKATGVWPRRTTGSTPASRVERVLWSGADTPGAPGVSQDGRFIAYVEDEHGNLVIRDLTTGKDRLVTDGSWGRASAEQPVFSRDGTRVAYGWLFNQEDDGYWQLRVVDLTEPKPTPRLLFEYKQQGWFGPYDWSPDGTRIGVMMRTGDGTSRIGWVSVTDGSLHILASADWRMSRMLAWSPDGQYLAYDAAANERATTADVYLARTDGSGVQLAVSGPGNDSVAGWTAGGDLLYLKDSRGSADLWRLSITNGSPNGSPQLVRTDIRGNLTSSVVSGTLNLSVMFDPQALYVAVVDVGSGQLLKPPAPGVSSSLPRNKQPNWSKDGKRLAYLSNGQERQLSYRILSIQTGDEDQARVMPLRLAQIWTYDWSPDQQSLLARAQSLQGRTGIYKVDVRDGEASPLLLWTDDLRQFAPTWADDGKSFYYTRVPTNGPGSYIRRELASGRETVVLALAGLKAPDGTPMPATRDLIISPDRRYIACYTVSPESTIWVISLADRSVRMLYRVPKANAFTHNALIWTPDSHGVLLNAGEAGNRDLWYAPLTGSPRKLDIGAARLRNDWYAIHPDGHQIAFVAGDAPSYELVRIDDVTAGK